jgi:hypothetical protein
MTARAPALALLLAAACVNPAAADPVRALGGMARVGVDVRLDPVQTALSVEQLSRRVSTRLGELAPTLTVDPASRDRLDLDVAVRRHGASALRGFWLPFSGTYAIGPVRLRVERLVTVTGVPAAVPATVWHTERHAAGPWRSAPDDVLKLVDETLTEFVGAYRTARR